MKILPNDHSGLTLIELLVSITIVGILMVIGLASYNEFNRTQILKQAALNLKNDLRVAQNKALAGEKITCGSLDGYQVSFTQGQYVLAAACAGGTSVTVISVNLPNNVIFSSFPSCNPSCNPLLFKVLGQGTNITNETNIVLSGFGKTQTITVTRSGEVK